MFGGNPGGGRGGTPRGGPNRKPKTSETNPYNKSNVKRIPSTHIHHLPGGIPGGAPGGGPGGSVRCGMPVGCIEVG